MVDRAELFRIADEILAEGRDPSQRAIRERLARGGSFSDIGPLFVEWTVLRGHRPRPRAEDLPQHLRDRLGTMAADIWADGLRNGVIAGQSERDQLIAERDALRLALVEMTAIAGVLENASKAPARGGEPALGPVVETPPRRRETIAFWDCVMQEIADLMEDRSLKPSEIFRLLDEDTARDAPKWTDKKWGPGFLADRMRGRARQGKFFEEPKPGYFRRLSVTAQAASATATAAAGAATSPESPTMSNVVQRGGEVGVRASSRPSLRELAAKSPEDPAEGDIHKEALFFVDDWTVDVRASKEAHLPGDRAETA